MNYRSFAGPTLAIAAFAAFAACSKTTVQPAAAPAPAPMPAAGTATTATTTTTTTVATGGMPAGVTMAMVAAGDSIFHARSCKNCHGMDAKGGANGPDLTTASKLQHVDGSFDSFVRLITNGVPLTDIKDPSHTRPMPARGGPRPAPMTDDEVREAAAYVYSLSHPMH
ncbi:MAG TPA: cytochrome c [Gemmatimonadaceae bacterium]|jgi:mono/diheme cytochrome c family protein